MPGVKVVHEGDFVGVAAPEPETAAKALAALKAEWKPVTAEADSHSVFQYFKKTARGGAAASPNLTPYTIAYIAHVPLEPRAAVAEWDGDKLTVWTGTQRPFGVRSELAQAFGIPEDKRARDRARHRLRLRRQAHRRGRGRSRAPGEGAGQAGEARLDARRGIDLGLLPSRRR